MIRLLRKRGAASFPTDFVGAKLREKHVDLVERYFVGVVADKPMAFISAKWKSAKTKVRADTAGKCAYCEAATSTVAHGDVEHFRPKGIYWWLAYDFDNYLFACQICNQIYKSDSFPVTPDIRLVAPAMPAAIPNEAAALAALATTLMVDASLATDDDVRGRWEGEDADLVHPYLEDPEILFIYEADPSNEEVWLRPGNHARSARAYAASEKFLGLNREELRRDRYGFYSTLAVFRTVIDNGAVPPGTLKAIDKELTRLTLPKAPFAGMSRYFLRTWGLL
ncbi:hypothetical protein ACWGTI_23505 [Mesorhizobium sp. ArgA1]